MSLAKPLLLIVDDDQTNRELLRYMLEFDFDTAEIGNSSLCLPAIQTQRPDMILLDVMMPGIDGDDICYSLKKDPDTKSIPVIFISALSRQDYLDNFGELLANDYITKPVGAGLLLQTIKALLPQNAVH